MSVVGVEPAAKEEPQLQQQQTLTGSVPWELVAEFCPLNEILDLRLVSHLMADCMSELSPFTCAALLEQHSADLDEGLAFVSQTWKKPFQDYGVAWFAKSRGDVLETLLGILRVVQCLPKEMAVAYSGKHGRHAIPLQWNRDSRSLEAIPHDECHRKNCPTCRMRIPHDDNRADSEVYQYINIRYKKHRFDLTTFYPKCMPNLPPTLCCPLCRTRTERTLVLSMLSYQSAGVGSTSLSFTPHNSDDFSEAEGEDSDDEEEPVEAAAVNEIEDERSAKRQRTKDDAQPEDEYFALPPPFHDVALPHRNDVIRADNTKVAMTIHCTACRDFGVVAPATRCTHDDFSCHHQVESMDFATGTKSTVGAILVRNKCSNRCSNATLCRSCCRRSKHRPYTIDLNPNDLVQQKYWCKRCHPDFENGIYCNDCAWLTTVCHHM
jgi:hypothetical protein